MGVKPETAGGRARFRMFCLADRYCGGMDPVERVVDAVEQYRGKYGELPASVEVPEGYVPNLMELVGRLPDGLPVREDHRVPGGVVYLEFRS